MLQSKISFGKIDYFTANMPNKIKKIIFGKTKTYYNNLLATLIIYVITFPKLWPSMVVGLDSSYFWALNFLFHHDYHALKEIIFPLGPLGFLKKPLIEHHNFGYFLVFFTFLKMWFIYMFIVISTKYGERKVISYFIVTILSMLMGIDYLLIGIVFMYSFLYLKTKKYYLLAIASCIAFIGLSIKSSIGVSSFSIIIVAFILDYFRERDPKHTMKNIIIIFISVLVSGLIIFQDFGLLFRYLLNAIRLSIGYSSALSMFPPNNWVILSLFIISVFLPVLYLRKVNTKYVFLLLLPCLFAMWKHAMVRQDIYHVMILYLFLFLYWGFFIAFSEMKMKKILLLSVISTSLFYINMQHSWGFRPKKVEINGVINFENTIVNYKEFKNNNRTISEKNLNESILDKATLQLIGNSTIDSYPWELSYFTANKGLNWKVRRTVQSGSFARWLDEYNAQDFNRENGPEFIIFHYVKDKFGGYFGSIDNRYLLNDNPLTIYNIFNYYSLELKTDKFLLLKKNQIDNFISQQTEKYDTIRWNQWINVNDDEDIIRLKLFSEQNFMGKMKSFLYKTAQYFVDYKMEDGKVFTYRYIPENAKDGIWVHPLIRNPQTKSIEDKVVDIRFRCSHLELNKKNILYKKEKIKTLYKNDKNPNFYDYFNKNVDIKQKIIINYVNDFEKNDGSSIRSSTFSFSGKMSNKIKSDEEFSYTYVLSLDTLWEKTLANKLIIETDVKYIHHKSKATHVVSLSGSDKDFWKGNPLKQADDIWKTSLQVIELEKSVHSTGILKIYVWNNEDNNLYIDDMRINIKSIEEN